MSSEDDKTRLIRRSKLYQKPVSGGGGESNDESTRIISKTEAGTPLPITGVDADKTQLVRRNRPSDREVHAVTGDSPGASEGDPVTAWLVVLEGPGKGQQVVLGEQDNHVGRGGASAKPRVLLDIGDAGISRSNAFVVRYNPKNRKFKLLPGSGTNIVYLNGDDLDSPSELSTGDVIELSETKLQFVAFCGADFDWSDCYV